MREVFEDYSDEIMESMDSVIDDEVQRKGITIWALEAKSAIAFCLCCCERLFLNYAVFSRESGSGSESKLRKLIDIAWNNLLTGGDNYQAEMHELLDEAGNFILDEQEHRLAAHAATAISVVELSIGSFNAQPNEFAIECYRLVLQDILRFVIDDALYSGKSFSSVPDELFESCFWVEELDLNVKILKLLRGSEYSIGEAISEVRSLCINNSASNIGVTGTGSN
ncbi:DUF416 family protein [Chitinivorax sp. B]|uniref:DUF416 family protein n=1 Tax=Chitinivorax sp. B TaxID=2502235 RepID=UPI0010F73DC2|nr:DUF416 family protein [Chitinivorax sp. B]